MQNIHSERFVKGLFDEMAKTYGAVNLLSSLGFAYAWRKRAVYSISGDRRRICDLMTGGAECLSHIKGRFGAKSHVDLVDWCERMCDRAAATVARRGYSGCSVIEASALDLPAADQSYDAVISTFGLKTLTHEETRALAKEVKRVLKPGGQVSMLEFSVPRNPAVRFLFRLYVKYYVPFLGWLFLGNPDNYRMLWRYTAAFQDCSQALEAFREVGFEMAMVSHFFWWVAPALSRFRRPTTPAS